METDLFLIRRNMNVPVGYDRRVFLELKSGITGVQWDWFFHRTIEPRYEEARELHRRVAYEHIPPLGSRENVFELNAAELWRHIVLDEDAVFDGHGPEDYGYVDFYIAVVVYAGFRAPGQRTAICPMGTRHLHLGALLPQKQGSRSSRKDNSQRRLEEFWHIERDPLPWIGHGA